VFKCTLLLFIVDEAAQAASANGNANGSRRSVEGYFVPDTTGHQLLQDHREVLEWVKDKVVAWMVEQIQQQHKATSS